VPDPQDPQTFRRSFLNPVLRERDPHRALLHFYHDLITLRKHSPALRNCSKQYLEVVALPEHRVLLIRRWQPNEEELLIFASFASQSVSLAPPLPPGPWQKILDAEAIHYGGSGQETLAAVLPVDARGNVTLSPFAFALYRRAAQLG